MLVPVVKETKTPLMKLDESVNMIQLQKQEDINMLKHLQDVDLSKQLLQEGLLTVQELFTSLEADCHIQPFFAFQFFVYCTSQKRL